MISQSFDFFEGSPNGPNLRKRLPSLILPAPQGTTERHVRRVAWRMPATLKGVIPKSGFGNRSRNPDCLADLAFNQYPVSKRDLIDRI